MKTIKEILFCWLLGYHKIEQRSLTVKEREQDINISWFFCPICEHNFFAYEEDEEEYELQMNVSEKLTDQLFIDRVLGDKIWRK